MLPHEIVGDIMSMIVHDQFSLHSKHRTDGKAYTWFPQALHVCRYLRSVALECSPIWSYIDTSWPHLVGELLRRSRSAPLTAVVQLNENGDPTTPDNQAIQLVLEEMHRVKSLQFHENLVVTSLNLSYLPTGLFGNPASKIKDMNLKRLFVFNVRVPTELQILRGLQYLKINRCSRPEHFVEPIPNVSSVSQIVGVLSQCPDLIEFEYNDYEDLDIPMAGSDTRLAPVALPHLRRIDLTLNANSSVCILRHLVVPPEVLVYISGQFTLNFDAPIPPTYLLGFKTIKADMGQSFFIEAETEMGYILLDLIPSTWSWEYMFRAVPQLFGVVLSQLESFELDECHFLSSERGSFCEVWKSLLSSFTNLQYLRLSLSLSYVLVGLMDALGETNSGQCLICPILRELVLEVDCPTIPPPPVWEKTILCLRSRGEMHSRLAALDVSACKRVQPDTEQVRILASLVDSLLLPIL
ncbi:hypothetical protein BD410DRAFT_899500 [Rickenella mellea]|uniref:F-box domain-containing protein n=1 Tax=Rickenella mellea TaxID=50990 RepID=A0A4Y7PYX1_9AGAM|nr:hypothetical protein BD410DRAFT_899500 [Rickenella mellea]